MRTNDDQSVVVLSERWVEVLIMNRRLKHTAAIAIISLTLYGQAGLCAEVTNLSKSTYSSIKRIVPGTDARKYLDTYIGLRNANKLEESIEFAIAAHQDLIAHGYMSHFPLPIIVAAGDCYKRKDFNSVRRMYTKMLELSSEEEWILPQTMLWRLDITEGKPEATAIAIATLLKSNRMPTKPINRRALYKRLESIYEELNDQAGQTAMKDLLEDKHCPKCGSDKNIKVYVYGYTGNRGCVRDDWSPMFKCLTDDLEF